MKELLDFFIQYKSIIIFYLLVIIFLLVKRKKLEIQAKIIVLYRMKWGLKWMDKYAQKFREWVILFGYTGVGVGFVGLLFISFFLIKNLVDYFTQETVVQGASIVYPGMTVPGLGVLPFWDWIIAIFVIALIHEFSHGIVARAHNLEVKNTGLVFFGPILGAFVEPDEKKLRKEKDVVQYSVLAAGSFSNIMLAIAAIVLLLFVFTPIQQGLVTESGFTFDNYVNESYPFALAGISPGTIITGINGKPTSKFEEFSLELIRKEPGEEITVNTEEKNYSITLVASPNDPSKAFLGIQEIKNEYVLKDKFNTATWSFIKSTVERLMSFFRWLFLLSFGIGVFNLLPLPIVDGGRMAQVFLHKLKGIELGEKRYRQVSLFFLLVLLLNLFYPWLAKLF